MARFKLTEEQYRQIVEMVSTTPGQVSMGANNTSGKENKVSTITPETTKTTVTTDSNTFKKEVDTASQELKRQGPKAKPGKKASALVVGPNDGKPQTITCSRIITKNELREMQLRLLKKNSELYNLGDFLRR